jgi:glycosyltransferase involved in cell wall biosynthesis
MPAFRFVMPVRQAERWIKRSIASIRRQTVRDFRCVVLDDASTDRTAERAQRAIGRDERFLLVTSDVRRYALENIISGIRRIATEPDDVVVHVDGDDWLRHRRVLEVLTRVYDGGDVWITYGSFQAWNGTWRDRLRRRPRRGFPRAYPPEVLDAPSVRAYPWQASHLRTFRRFLWDQVRAEDLRDADGSWYRTTSDLAMMVPMLEMAGSAHAAYVREMLYVYNEGNPLGDHRLAAEEQRRVEARIRAAPPYRRFTAAPPPRAVMPPPTGGPGDAHP